MPHLQIEQNLTIYKIHSLNEQGNALLFWLPPQGDGRRRGHRAVKWRSRPHTYVQAGEGLQSVGEALGRSRGGFSTKIHLKTDLDGYPIGFHLTGGEASDQPQLRSAPRPRSRC
jgi:hypothetical protein